MKSQARSLYEEPSESQLKSLYEEPSEEPPEEPSDERRAAWGDFLSAQLCAFRRVPATQQVCFGARRASMI